VRVVAAIVLVSSALLGAQGQDDSWLTWSASRAQGIGKAAYVQGRVGGIFDTRFLKTERSYNYKLAATWLTADVIRATARIQQLTERLSDDQARGLVAEADKARDTVVMVEIDPREGSGVIPNDWAAFLQAQVDEGEEPRSVRGQDTPRLREVKALAGVLRRNYDYDRFWVVFPLTHADGKPLFAAGDVAAELVVRIADREGRVRFPIPSSIKNRP
jgi:hypothetical protein